MDRKLAGWAVGRLVSGYDRSAQAKAPIRSRTPESRNLLRPAKRDREGARARRSARELRVQGGARAPAIRASARASPAAQAIEALRCASRISRVTGWASARGSRLR